MKKSLWIFFILLLSMAYASEISFEKKFKGYFLDAENLKILNEMPSHLKLYVLCRLDLLHAFQKESEFIISEYFMKEKIEIRKIPLTQEPQKIKLDFSIKYKGVKQTKGERLSLQCNYLAREAEIAEGFEASENLRGYVNLNKNFKLISYIGVFEKWVDQSIDYDEIYQIPRPPSDVTGTIKCGIGCSWNILLARHQKIVFDFLMQQKANNQWKYQDKTFSDGLFSGVLFDHWVLTLGFYF